jgi:hypothetical protein
MTNTPFWRKCSVAVQIAGVSLSPFVVGFSVSILFILIPLLLIFFNLSILFKNFGSDDYTKDIESYIKNNGIQNVFSLLVKYNYPCFEK